MVHRVQGPPTEAISGPGSRLLVRGRTRFEDVLVYRGTLHLGRNEGREPTRRSYDRHSGRRGSSAARATRCGRGWHPVGSAGERSSRDCPGPGARVAHWGGGAATRGDGAELGAGTGDTGFAAAALVGDAGRLISTDFSPEMVEVAGRRGSRARPPQHRVPSDGRGADRPRLRPVDGVIRRSGYMLMADPDAALAETRRVSRLVGRLVLAVWSRPAQPVGVDRRQNAGRSRAHVATRTWVAGHLQPGERGSPARASRRCGLHRRGGWRRCLCCSPTAASTTTSPARVTTGGAFAVAFREAPQEERERMKQEIADAFAPFSVDGGYELPGVALVAVAR